MWYKYENQLINLDKCFKINLEFDSTCIAFHFSKNKFKTIDYIKYEERDAEFEKICEMLGLDEPEHISRCC